MMMKRMFALLRVITIVLAAVDYSVDPIDSTDPKDGADQASVSQTTRTLST